MSLLFAQYVIATCAVYNLGISRDTLRAAYHLGYLAELFRTLSAATVMIFLLELGPGMHYAMEGVSSAFDKIIRYIAFFLAFVITALAIAYYGLLVDFQVNYTNKTGVVNRYSQQAQTDRIHNINYLMGTTAVILFTASLVITGLSIYTFLRRKLSPLKTVRFTPKKHPPFPSPR